MKNTIFRLVFFLVLVPAVLFQLRHLSVPGGDSAWIVTLVERPLYFFFRAPLVVVFHKALWLLLNGWGWSAGDCVSLSSALAGGVFFWGLYRLSTNWRLWVPFLFSCIPWIFFGHQETYPWPFALSVWVFIFLKRRLRGCCGPLPLYLFLLLATFAHPMAFMLWPGVIFAQRPWDREKLKPLLISIVITGLLLVVFLLFGKAGGLPQRKWVLPVFEVGRSLTRYPIFSWRHWMELGWFYLISMPVGAFLLIRFGFREWRGWIGGLNVTVLVTIAWSLIWHPGMGYNDWDLFSWPGLFVNLAGGLAWSRASDSPQKRKGVLDAPQNENSPPGIDPSGEFSSS
ncbi:MAG: hypothetical protein KC994_00060 [Candidatus Omnitrophica bacterium]|nr:hypothetical protein [Candidatus Omnitrophota bacterium]